MNPVQGDSSHVYVGTDGRGDVWQIVDAGGDVIEWAVNPGDDSRNVIPGTVNNLGPPSSMTAAQAVTPTPVTAAPQTVDVPAAVSTPTAGDPRHKYVGTDSRGDVWQIFDGTNVIEWAVPVNSDSRNVIAGSLRNLGAPSSMTTAQAAPIVSTPPPPSNTPVPAGSAPVTVKPPANNAPYSPGTVGTDYTTPPPLVTSTGNTASNRPPIQSDPRHKFVGRDERGDVWQIFDGTDVIEWAVAAGQPSGEVIQATLRNIGPPSVMSVAQDDGWRSPSTTALARPVPPAMNSGTSTAAQAAAAAAQVLRPVAAYAPSNSPGATTATGAAETVPAGKSDFLVIAGIVISALSIFK